ncbi:MAG: PTS sugar transporter subunit IIC [Clostridia bacterium]|nr:PTS sugar transporter subunit IIC [Clostridia bacterium]
MAKQEKGIFYHIFIDGFSGMASGLFATLIVGTILALIADLIGDIPVAWCGVVSDFVRIMANVAKAVMGAGIGVGVAKKYKASDLVTVSAAVAGMVGAFASQLLAGTAFDGNLATLKIPGEPLGAFVAAFVAIEVGMLVSGKTKVDILVTPIVSIASGSVIGLFVGAPISTFMTYIGKLVCLFTEEQPFMMGIVVAVVMGMVLTLPISSAALAIMLGLTGITGGAAAVGCSAQMIGFAVSSYRENKMGGLVAQGVGTSMLQVPNIFKRPLIWVPPTLTAAILGPISTCVFHLVNNPSGAGMGTSGLVGPIMGYQEMTNAGISPWVAILEILVMYILLPAALSLGISEGMRKFGWIKAGDMKLDS